VNTEEAKVYVHVSSPDYRTDYCIKVDDKFFENVAKYCIRKADKLHGMLSTM
jgi:hypothetical protein